MGLLPVNKSINHINMKKAISFSLLVILIMLLCEAKSLGQVQLFDGHSLNGWYTFLQDRGRDNDPKEVFTVKME